MRVALVAAVVAAACGSSSSPAPAPAAAPVAVATASPALQSLDAMLDEIDAGWKTGKASIRVPRARPGFTVTAEDGVPVLHPEAALSLAEVEKHLTKRAAGVTNPGLAQYKDGSLVAVDPGGGAPPAQIVLALNDTLIIVLTASRHDPKLVWRIEVAMP